MGDSFSELYPLLIILIEIFFFELTLVTEKRRRRASFPYD